jgi:transposase-like protein
MPNPRAPSLDLPDAQRRALQRLSQADSTPQALAFRCRLILRAAQGDSPSNGHVADELGCDRHTVATWRRRFRDQGLAGLQDRPRPGRPPGFSPRATRRRPRLGVRTPRRLDR